MNLVRDWKKQIDERRKEESAKVQLRKRSMDSISRPKAKKNILNNDPRMQGIWSINGYIIFLSLLTKCFL